MVYNSDDTETDIVLKGVVRAEKLQQPENHIDRLLERADAQKIMEIYGVESWTDGEDFLEKLAFRRGKLLKGGEAHYDAMARLVIRD